MYLSPTLLIKLWEEMYHALRQMDHLVVKGETKALKSGLYLHKLLEAAFCIYSLFSVTHDALAFTICYTHPLSIDQATPSEV